MPGVRFACPVSVASRAPVVSTVITEVVVGVATEAPSLFGASVPPPWKSTSVVIASCVVGFWMVNSFVRLVSSMLALQLLERLAAASPPVLSSGPLVDCPSLSPVMLPMPWLATSPLVSPRVSGVWDSRWLACVVQVWRAALVSLSRPFPLS